MLDRWLPAGPAGLADAAGPGSPRCHAVSPGSTPTCRSPRRSRSGTASRFDRLGLEADCNGGTLALHHAVLAGPDVSLTLDGTLSAAGQVRDGRAELALGHAEVVTGRMPGWMDPARALFHGPLSVGLAASGPATALAVTAAAELSDARVQANGLLDLRGRHWKGAVSLHHPGATRLLYSLGLGDMAGWLGDGSLSLQAVAEIGPDGAALSGAEVSAGALRASGDLAATALASGHPALTGRLDADTLPLPAVNTRSAEPWSLAPLHAFDAKVALRAAHLLWGSSPFADDAAATLSLADGALRVGGLSARVAGGTLAAQMSLADANPPRFAASGTLGGALVDGPLTGFAVDLVAGHLDAALDLTATGYSPAGVVTSLAGSARATVRDGALSGLDAGRVLSVLQAAAPGRAGGVASVQSDVAEALRTGTTQFGTIRAEGTVSHGTVALGQAAVSLAAGSMAVTGSLDLPEEAIDAHLALQPALEAAPLIGLRLIGPVAAPSRSPELAELTRWLADR